jgi:MFS family permease
MLGQLKLNYAEYLLLIATSYSARIMVLPFIAAMVRGLGARKVLWFSGIGVLPLSALWYLGDSVAWLFVVQLIAGAVWAAYELTTFLLLFETIREEERTSVLTTYNLAHAVCTVGGASIGGWILSAFGTDLGAYMSAFLISACVRIPTLILLLRAVRIIPIPSIPPEPVPVPTRIMAVRPQMGAIDRPILSGMPSMPSVEEKQPSVQSSS